MIIWFLKKWFDFTDEEIKEVTKAFNEYYQGKQRDY